MPTAKISPPITAAGLLIGAALLVVAHWYRENPDIDTQAMADVSVTVKTISHVRVDRLGDSVWEPGSGSGFMVSSEDCEVWTNHHVVADAAIIEVIPTGWSSPNGIRAVLVHSTPRGDMAVLRMEHCHGIPQAVLGDSSRVRAGDEAFAVGNPLGRHPSSISRGIISHPERYANGPVALLQTDAAINPGNSGGALFNHKGEVIGVNVGLASNNLGMNVGLGYAVPINVAKQVIADLREGPPSWGSAGLTGMLSTLSPETAEMFGVPTARGAVIVARSPEQGPSSGKLQIRDVIYRLNNQDVHEITEVIRLISSYAAGERVYFQVIRDGEPHLVDVVLEEGWSVEDSQRPAYFEGYLGMELQNWLEQEGELGNFNNPVITKVHSLGPAHQAKIASSQKGLRANGSFMYAFQLDVKTVTGVVYDGKYRPVGKVEELRQLARAAYQTQKPLLLEIALWTRPNAQDTTGELQHTGTGFFRIRPALTAAEVPESAWHPVSGKHFPIMDDQKV